MLEWIETHFFEIILAICLIAIPVGMIASIDRGGRL